MFVDINEAPQTLAELYRNMGDCGGFRAEAAWEKYPGFVLLASGTKHCQIVMYFIVVL